MLPDFYEEVLKRLDTVSKSEMSKLVAADGDARHDLIRGHIQAYADAKSIVQDVFREFNGDPDAPDEDDIRDAYNTQAQRRGNVRPLRRGGAR